MVFDLTKDTVRELYGLDRNDSNKSWEWPGISYKRIKPPLHSKEMMQSRVCKKVLDLFEYASKANSEKLVICWNRKRRDFVDNILLRENHEEEAEWTNYEEEEGLVKNEITMGILDSLLDETVQIILDIRKSKTKNSYALT